MSINHLSISLRYALLILLIFPALRIHAENPIDFSTSENLKAVYDAGFRPWRTGMSSCHLDHVKVSVILPGNIQFYLPAEMAEFNVLVDDQLSDASFIGEVTSTDEAVAKIREICNSLGISTVGLDQAVPSFADRYSKPLRWGGMTKKGGVSVQVMLDVIPFFDHLEAKVDVILHWNREGVPMKFLTKPVQPPPGYENASMDPPKVNSNQKGFPEHGPEYYKDLIDKKRAEEGKPPTSFAPSQSPPQATPTPQVQPLSETSIPFWVYGIIVLILGVIVALWYRSRPKQ